MHIHSHRHTVDINIYMFTKAYANAHYVSGYVPSAV